jgi:hypothetical protein
MQWQPMRPTSSHGQCCQQDPRRPKSAQHTVEEVQASKMMIQQQGMHNAVAADAPYIKPWPVLPARPQKA